MDRLLFDLYSFGSKGLEVVTEEFIGVCEQFINQMRVHPAIDNVSFKHEAIGKELTVCLRRHGDDFVVSLEGKHFTIED